MTVAHARALLPVDSVEVRAHDPAGDARALRALGERLCESVPVVALDPPDGLLMDASGCERMYRGVEPIARRVHDAISELGFSVRVALAPSPSAAWGLARFCEDAITIVDEAALCARVGALPVRALRIEDEAVEALHELGFTRLSELMDLSRSSLPARFGDELLLCLDRMRGRAIEPITAMRPEATPACERLFDGPVADLGIVCHVLRELLDELGASLASRELGLTGLEVRIERADLGPARILIPTSRPTRDMKHLWKLLEHRLERLSLGSGVERLRVIARRRARLAHEQASAWRGREGGDIAGLIDTLSARLGPARVRRMGERDTRWPDRRFVSVAAIAGERGATVADAPSAEEEEAPTDRPSLVFACPIACDVVLMAPDGPLMRVRWRGASREVLVCVGPERIEPEWWRDGSSMREYFRVQLAGGTWLWLCREQERWLVRGEWV